MSKRTFTDADMENPDIHAEASPKHPRLVSMNIHLDKNNIMDNWLRSSRELEAQQHSDDYEKQEQWTSRKDLEPMGRASPFLGSWQYTPEKGSETIARLWAKDAAYRDAKSIKAEAEDAVISKIYWSHWMKGDRKGFLNAIYQEYGLQGDALSQSPTDLYPANAIPEENLWKIFRCLTSELVPKSESDRWNPTPPTYIIENPDTIWQIAKCIFLILTRGRFWNDTANVLQPIDQGERFGEFKKAVLQKETYTQSGCYSKSLLKFVLGCLSYEPGRRYSRFEILEQCRKVLNGEIELERVPEPMYIPTDETKDFIPTGLTQCEGAVYETLMKIVTERKDTGNLFETPHIVTVTDLAKDYDDLMAMMCLKELHRLGVVHLKGFVANLVPADRRARFGRGVLDHLDLNDVPVAEGSIGKHEDDPDEHKHEFDGTETFIAPPSRNIEKGPVFLKRTLQGARDKPQKLTLLLISSLMDISEFSDEHPDLVRSTISHVVLQGGYRVINGTLTADPEAANNKFDVSGANKFHKFMDDNTMESTAWTKVATFEVPIYNSLFVTLEETGHPIGSYLRKVQVKQDKAFYATAVNGTPFMPHMTQEWYLEKKSTWYEAGHEPDEPWPTGDEIIPYFTKVVAYDALAAVGTAGPDVLEALDLPRPLVKRPDADQQVHRLVGVPAIQTAKSLRAAKEPNKPSECNLNAEKMGIVIAALTKGSIMATQQKLVRMVS